MMEVLALVWTLWCNSWRWWFTSAQMLEICTSFSFSSYWSQKLHVCTEEMNLLSVWMVSSTQNDRTTFIINGCSIPNKHNYDGISNGIRGGSRQTHNEKNFWKHLKSYTKKNFKKWWLWAYGTGLRYQSFRWCGSESHLCHQCNKTCFEWKLNSIYIDTWDRQETIKQAEQNHQRTIIM